MCTLDIVGINLKHRLRVHAGSLCHTKVLIGFLTDSLLRTVSDEHAAGKGSHGIFIKHILVKFITCAMRYLMINECVIVNMLLFVGNYTAITVTFCPLAFENEVKTVASDPIMQCDYIMIDTAVSLLLYINIAHTDILQMGFFKAIEF